MTKIKPTHGSYQKDRNCEIVKETINYIYVHVDGNLETDLWKFNRDDMLRTGNYKNEFPRYQLEL